MDRRSAAGFRGQCQSSCARAGRGLGTLHLCVHFCKSPCMWRSGTEKSQEIFSSKIKVSEIKFAALAQKNPKTKQKKTEKLVSVDG